ncbi:hypothetical protein EPIR_1524 [Erwinia piriflorinigrans CFBP 5888]|uniref:Uncharacterized protein n=1 Tax=Erwinia piriflorinigrans CFBP 5888 TaxID=1161919 RepID=V5Z7F1_9GAMM|nr:hypothetical protein EPIR_1524 [Erwinia piriflorinigrans CFBP 5888]
MQRIERRQCLPEDKANQQVLLALHHAEQAKRE